MDVAEKTCQRRLLAEVVAPPEIVDFARPFTHQTRLRGEEAGGDIHTPDSREFCMAIQSRAFCQSMSSSPAALSWQAPSTTPLKVDISPQHGFYCSWLIMCGGASRRRLCRYFMKQLCASLLYIWNGNFRRPSTLGVATCILSI